MLSPTLEQFLTDNLSPSLLVTGKIYSGKGLFNITLNAKNTWYHTFGNIGQEAITKENKILRSNPPKKTFLEL